MAAAYADLDQDAADLGYHLLVLGTGQERQELAATVPGGGRSASIRNNASGRGIGGDSRSMTSRQRAVRPGSARMDLLDRATARAD